MCVCVCEHTVNDEAIVVNLLIGNIINLHLTKPMIALMKNAKLQFALDRLLSQGLEILS